MRVTEEAPHRIVELIEGGAAKESHKLMVGDHILKIAGRETKSLSMSQVAAYCFPRELLLCTVQFAYVLPALRTESYQKDILWVAC